MVVYRCDLCNEIRDCTQRVIGDKEYDICSECWNSLAEKLKGKGRAKRPNENIVLPALPVTHSPEGPKPSRFPGSPPTIFSSADPVN